MLGVPRNADKDALKKAFRKLAQQYHPDVNKTPEAEARFKEINEAYQVLSDDQKRGPPMTATVMRACKVRRAATATWAALATLAASSKNSSAAFSRTGGAGAANRRQPRRGADLRADIRISFEEAAFGAERELEIPRMEACDRCKGSGAEPPTQPVTCHTCNGTGEVKRRQQSPLFGTVITATP